jgi:undecaprenyl-phosphate 4-deoxy-4-formamido-L-arabinose transferase
MLSDTASATAPTKPSPPISAIHSHNPAEASPWREGVSVVIPVYRAEAALTTLHQALVEALTSLAVPCEILFVEDCGGDQSWSIIEDIARRDPSVRGIRLSRNAGQHGALLCGIRQARYPVTVTMDDDLQHPVADVRNLLESLNDQTDVVYGVPMRAEHSIPRVLASRLTSWIILSGVSQPQQQLEAFSAFRAFKTRLRDGFAHYEGPQPSVDVLLSWSSTHMRSVKVPFAQRFAGESNYTLRALVRHAFGMLTGFSNLPLHVASLMGFTFALFGFGLLGYAIINYLVHGGSVPGFTFIASVVSLFAGIQLLVLGLIGEYIARIYFRTMRQPSYVVAETTPTPTPLRAP